ncbi:MAG: hypothetical protein ACI87A_002981, partial [Planctomycetota bacterium]
EWDTVKRLLQTAVKRFGSDTDAATIKTMTVSVLPELATALLELHEVRDAGEILTKLVSIVEQAPSSSTARNYSRAIAGWIEGGEGEIIEIPGMRGEEALDKAVELLTKLAGTAESWSCEWYSLRFELAYANYQWSLADGKKLQSAKNVLNQLNSDLSAGLAEITEACGDDVLRQRFLWLEKKL